MFRKFYCGTKSNSGQALVEFVFIFLIFFFIFWSIVEVCLLVNTKYMVNVAAHAVCRTFVTTYSKGKAKSAAIAYLAKESSVLGGKLLYYNIKFEPDKDPGFGNKIKVIVEAYCKPVIIGALFPIKLTSACSMTME